MDVPMQLSQPSTKGDPWHQAVSLRRWETKSQWTVHQPESLHIKVLLITRDQDKCLSGSDVFAAPASCFVFQNNKEKKLVSKRVPSGKKFML